MATESGGCRPAAYSRRHPEQTVLYRIIQQHLETYLMLAREGDWDGDTVPVYVSSGHSQLRERPDRMSGLGVEKIDRGCAKDGCFTLSVRP